jgi:cytochrome c oxidase assembly protein subunit 15
MNSSQVPLYNLAPIFDVLVLGALIALAPLGWVWRKHRRDGPGAWLKALTWMTLFLTFDLVLFGAFTRLTDSGLGCPDWPGCYGSASPFGAHAEISAAQSSMPTGPVTHSKAWIEMVHRYFATGVGALITALMLASWLLRRHVVAVSPWWSTVTFVWVCVQGAFGALTVTLKLYPAVVTAHLLGGLVLLGLLAWQAVSYEPRPLQVGINLRRATGLVLLLSLFQVLLGGWVSTNYAVLACSDFPMCQGQWWPPMDFEHGFTVLRGLGEGRDGGALPFAALTAIHMVHRMGAVVLLCAIGWLVWRLLHYAPQEPRLRRYVAGLLAVALWQVATGVSNVVLGWPLLAALAHTGGAAALIVVLTTLLAQAWHWRARLARLSVAVSAAAASRAAQ